MLLSINCALFSGLDPCPFQILAAPLSGSGDIMVFVCHVIFQDHAIKVLYDFMVWSLSS